MLMINGKPGPERTGGLLLERGWQYDIFATTEQKYQQKCVVNSGGNTLRKIVLILRRNILGKWNSIESPGICRRYRGIGKRMNSFVGPSGAPGG
jgi:hypothetical protein